MMETKGVIFDFNGTLFFDNDKHLLAWETISKMIRGKGISQDELHNHFNGVPNQQIIQYLFDQKASQEDIDKYSKLKEQYYRQYCKEDTKSFHLVAGAESYFEMLVKQNIPFTIASASIKENIDFFIKSFHLDKWINPQDIVYDNGKYENKVAMFQDAAKKLGLDMKDITVFEDSLSGIKNAHLAGSCQIVVIDSANKADEYINLPGVIKVCHDFTDLTVNINLQINRLIHFAMQNKMIERSDEEYAVNLLLDLFHLDNFEKETVTETLKEATPILEEMLNYAVEKELLENNITARDLFDTRIMNCVMPRPSEVVKKFNEKCLKSVKRATDYYYRLSIASNYIRKSRTDKNIRFKEFYKYGDIEITINLSKPEKDPKEIAKAKLVKSSGYPKCLLCKENVGFAGNLNHAARQTHRIIPLNLNGKEYYLQYSPYVYYNEHCIVFNAHHQPMVINHDTFVNLLSFIEQFPHYMLGSNADLPIVGGSILTHDHYQGGSYTFPIENAAVLKKVYLKQYPELTIELMKWPLSTIRVTSFNKQAIIDFADAVLAKWRQYSNQSLNILSATNGIAHNTITPIARMKKDKYQLDLVLRNNRTSEEYPDGIFHPHQNLHHIKKENIGLIEVMGLAVLPARLKTELEELKECLLHHKDINTVLKLEKHRSWYNELKQNYDINLENVDNILKQELTKKFVEVLEDAGVFKMNDEGINAFIEFVENI